MKRLAEHAKLSLAEAQRWIRERDLDDVAWIHRYFGLDSHAPALFGQVINTARISPADAADLVLQALGKLSKKQTSVLAAHEAPERVACPVGQPPRSGMFCPPAQYAT